MRAALPARSPPANARRPNGGWLNDCGTTAAQHQQLPASFSCTTATKRACHTRTPCTCPHPCDASTPHQPFSNTTHLHRTLPLAPAVDDPRRLRDASPKLEIPPSHVHRLAPRRQLERRRGWRRRQRRCALRARRCKLRLRHARQLLHRCIRQGGHVCFSGRRPLLPALLLPAAALPLAAAAAVCASQPAALGSCLWVTGTQGDVQRSSHVMGAAQLCSKRSSVAQLGCLLHICKQGRGVAAGWRPEKAANGGRSSAWRWACAAASTGN